MHDQHIPIVADSSNIAFHPQTLDIIPCMAVESFDEVIKVPKHTSLHRSQVRVQELTGPQQILVDPGADTSSPIWFLVCIRILHST